MATKPPRHNPAPGKKRPTRPRRSPSARGYGHKWRKFRARWLREHPLCEHCKARGHTEPATDVDHIVPHRGDMDIFWKEGNYMSLCHSCHSKKTGKGQ